MARSAFDAWAPHKCVSAVARRIITAAEAAGLTLVAQHDETAAAEDLPAYRLQPPVEAGQTPDPFGNLAAHIRAGILALTDDLRKAG